MATVQYLSKEGLYATGRLIEKAVADAEASGAKVLTLGLLNQVHTPSYHHSFTALSGPSCPT
jgi:aldehyde decarbonylase